MRRRAWAAAAGLLLPLAWAWGTETLETYRGAFSAFLQGRYQEAESGYKYLLTLGVDGAGPTENLALLARDQGRADEAAAEWIKATMLDGYDAGAWNQRGWTHLSIGRLDDARQAFRKAVEVSSAPYQAAEAEFGRGLAEQLDGNPKAAISAYQGALIRSPYLAPAVATQLARLAVQMRKWQAAELYFKQSLDQDPQQPDIALELSRVLEKVGNVKAAWQGYKLVLDMDPALQEAREGMERTAKAIPEKPERLLPVRRLGRPLVHEPETAPESPPLRVGLFSTPAGDSAHATRFYFLSASDFRISDVRLGEVARGTAYDQWDVFYRSDTRVIELRDPQQNLKFTTKQPFRIEPLQKWATVLVKSAALNDIKGVDIGDRELRGVVEVVPTPDGFALVNEVATDDYVSSALSGLMPGGSPREALRAQAVLVRSRAALVAKGRHQPFLNTDLCDSAHCELYAGITQERAAGREAALSTAGGRLFRGGAPLAAAQHLSCGWATEERGEDGPAPAPLVRSAWDLDRLVRAYPPPSLFCEASSVVPPAWSRWVRVIDGDMLRARIERSRVIGRLHDLRVAARTPTGRVTALDAVGARETVRIEGTQAISDLLAPGSLRSTLFTLQPLYDGKVLRHLVVWGAGTGDGHGLCVAGAIGQAHLGRKYRDILAHYFPGAEVQGAPADPSPAEPRAATGGVTPKEQTRARAKRAARLRAAQKARAASRAPAAPPSAAPPRAAP